MAALARPSAPPTALRFGPGSPLDRGGGGARGFFSGLFPSLCLVDLLRFFHGSLKVIFFLFCFF